MKYLFAVLVTLGLIIFLLAVIYLAVSKIIRHYKRIIRHHKDSHAIWEVRHKDLYNGQVQLWIERGPSTDLWTKVDASTDSFLYEYSRLEDACNERNATRKALHL